MKISKIMLVAGLVMTGVAGTAQSIQVTKVNDVESRDGTTFYIPSTTSLKFSGVYGSGEDPKTYAVIETIESTPIRVASTEGWLGKNTFTYYATGGSDKLLSWDGKEKAVTLAGNNSILAYPTITGYGINPPALALTAPSTVTIKKYVPEFITITAMRATKGQTVNVNITVANEDSGKQNDFYVVALLSDNSIYSCIVATQTACTAWAAGIYPLTSNLTTATETQTVATQMDLTGLGGTTVYAGYAWNGSGTEKIGVGRAWKYTSQKIQ